ncbi:MAG: hypothetical protein IPK80_16315 [Nannocystis sp.]|nr:hypothetical protein [Nannocystis sp.]
MTRLASLLSLAMVFSLACSGDDKGGGTTSGTTDTTDAGSTSLTTASTSASTSTSAAETDTSGSSSSSGSGSTTTDATTDATTTDATDTAIDPTEPPPCEVVVCDKGKVWQCGDCMDNDGDGLVDIADPDCLSPCHNDEATFGSGLPGDNMDPCNQDCYFDGNSGAGDDNCNWSLKCDPNSPGGETCPYDPGYKNCPMEQSEQCVGFCQAPNGCDCFGCCTIELDGESYDIFLGDPNCSSQTIETCQTCTKNDQCDNVCIPENCELCFGQSELPPGCEEPSCDDKDPCKVDAMGNDNCPAGTFCSTGCCVPIIPG